MWRTISTRIRILLGMIAVIAMLILASWQTLGSFFPSNQDIQNTAPTVTLLGNVILQIRDVLLALLHDKRVFYLFIAVLLLNIPILIYRYIIKKLPLPPDKARKYAHWYGGIAIIIVSSFLSLNGISMLVAILLLEYLTYIILKIGYVEEEETLDVNASPPVAPNYRTCTKCNALASLDSLYCPVCGAKTTKDAV